MATVNYTDQIIERLKVILSIKFKKSIKIFREDNFKINHNSISLVESGSINEHTWAPNIVVDRFFVDCILRHVHQKDENKKEWLNKDFHRMKTSILEYRSDSTVGWYNGLVNNTDEIELELDDSGNSKFWKKILHFSCLVAYDYTE